MAPPAGASVSFRAAVSRAADTRPMVAVDWSAGGVHATFDGNAVVALADLDALLELLSEPHQIVVEATFESFDADHRRQALAQVRAAGHELYGFRPKDTGRARPSDWVKTDANDARVIHALALDGRVHMSPLADPHPDWVSFRTAVCDQYLELRLAGHKDELAAAAIAILGPYGDLPEEARKALGNDKGYSTSALAVLYVACWHTRGREQFERLLGLHGSGYPSVLRSDYHHHHVRHRFNKQVPWQVLRRQLRGARSTLAAAFAAGEGVDPQALLDAGPRVRQSAAPAKELVFHALEDAPKLGPVPDADKVWLRLAALGGVTPSQLAAELGLAAVQVPLVQMRLSALARARRAKRTGKQGHYRWHALGVPAPAADPDGTPAAP